MDSPAGARPVSDGRAEILGRIRRSLGRGPLDAAAREALDARAPAHPLPQRAQGAPAALVDRFVAMAEQAAATVGRVAADGIPEAVRGFLAAHNLPSRIVAAPHPGLEGLDWASVPALDVRFGTTDGDDLAGLSVAAAGVAETGTLVLRSGADTPTRLTFLSETHLVVLRESDVVGGYEAALDRLAAEAGWPPRTVNMVTGPSRSADIEQTLQMGAHGPRRLHILLVGA